MRIPDRRLPPPPLVGLLALALGLIAVAALASRAHILGESAPPVSASASRVILDSLFYLALVFEAAVLVMMVWAVWPDGSGQPQARRPSLWQTLVTPLAGLALIALALLYRDHIQRALNGLQGAGGSGHASAANLSNPSPAGVNSHSGFDWLAFGIVALLVATALAYLFYLRRKGRRREIRQKRRLAAELEQVMAESVEELAMDPDPRRAVIAAYARMERVLAAQGSPRHPAEAPTEYVRRLLGQLELRGELLYGLTELYEQARFSAHEIDPRMRAQAIDLLERIRADLRELAQPAEFQATTLPVRV
jgi:hypothetical protein